MSDTPAVFMADRWAASCERCLWQGDWRWDQRDAADECANHVLLAMRCPPNAGRLIHFVQDLPIIERSNL